MKFLRRHARRTGSLAATYLLGGKWMLALLGWTTRLFPVAGIHTVFLLYPANQKYAEAYVYRWHQERIKWRPGLVGLFQQNGSWGLTFGVSATEGTS